MWLDASQCVLLPATVYGCFRHADWRAARRRGTWGVLQEAGRALLGANSRPFCVPARGPQRWTEHDLRLLFRRRGVTAWGFGVFAGELYFRVPERQGWLAYQVLTQAGVKLLHEHYV